MCGDSCSKSCGFESQRCILDGRNIFSNIFVVRIVMFVWKDKNKLIGGREWPVFKKKYYFNLFKIVKLQRPFCQYCAFRAILLKQNLGFELYRLNRRWTLWPQGQDEVFKDLSVQCFCSWISLFDNPVSMPHGSPSITYTFLTQLAINSIQIVCFAFYIERLFLFFSFLREQLPRTWIHDPMINQQSLTWLDWQKSKILNDYVTTMTLSTHNLKDVRAKYFKLTFILRLARVLQVQGRLASSPLFPSNKGFS